MSEQYVKVPIRLAIRRQGDYLNAYIARDDTLDGATLIGSLLYSAASRDRALRDGFKQSMQRAMSNVIEDLTGHRPRLEEQPIPAHESRQQLLPGASAEEVALSRALTDVGKGLEATLADAIAGERSVLHADRLGARRSPASS